MNNPSVGALNKRVRFEFKKTIPNDQAGFTNKTVSEFTVWGRIEPVGSQIFWDAQQLEKGVTHRVYVRSIPGKTRPQDLEKVIRIVCEGLRYRMRRVADIAGEDRFTVIEVQSEGVQP